MPHRLTLAQMAGKIRSREISPVELVEAHLRQIEKQNPKVNVFVRVLAEEAMAQAQAAEQAIMNGAAQVHDGQQVRVLP